MFHMRKRSLLLCVLALVCLLLLFVGGPTADAPRPYRYGWDLGHLFCFALWTYLYLQWAARQNFWKQCLTVAGLALLIGGMTEILQLATGREASWNDLGKDLLGSSVGLVLFAPGRFEIGRWQLRSLQLVVVGVLIWSLLPLGKVVVDDLIAWQQFPLLAGFETPFETSRWEGNSRRRLNRNTVFSGAGSLRVRLNTDRYSGAFLVEFPRDWSPYRLLQLQVNNPDSEELLLHLRIHDQDHRKHGNAYRDRFSTSFKLQSGWNLLEISLEKVARAPRDRPMDMRRIAAVGVFVARLQQPRMIYIDEVKLLP